MKPKKIKLNKFNDKRGYLLELLPKKFKNIFKYSIITSSKKNVLRGLHYDKLLNEMFKTKTVQKTYWAIVDQKPLETSETLVHFLKKNQKQNKSYAFETEKEGYKRSELDYKLISSSDKYHLLEVKPKTGRHHQIRVQLSTIGSSIKGDLKYGAKRSNKNASICLHALKIEFIHPVQKEHISISAPVPEDSLWSFFNKKSKTEAKNKL